MPAAATGFNGDGFGDKITNRRMDTAAGEYDYLDDEDDGDAVPRLAVPGAAALTLNHGDTEPIKDTAASREEIGAETRGDDGDGDTDTTNTTDTPDTATDTPDSATNTPDTGDGGDEDKKLGGPPPPSPRPAMREPGLVPLLLALLATAVQTNPDAKRLYDDLLSNYNRLIRPVANNTDKITVKMGLKLSQLVDLVSTGIHLVLFYLSPFRPGLTTSDVECRCRMNK